jgi:predicted O-methyltransferase YrrM
MNGLDPRWERYAGQFTSPEPPLLHRINRETHLQVLQPRMLSGHFQGRLLAMISRMIRPHRILEIGTYTGYSALCLAEGLPPDGRLITLDVNAELEQRVRNYFEQSPYGSQIDYRVGDARQIIPTLNENWELVFIDADKAGYRWYYDAVFDQLKPGGVILADNVMWSGKVTEPAEDNDTRVMQQFNEYVNNDTRVEKVLLPIRDGLYLIQKPAT